MTGRDELYSPSYVIWSYCQQILMYMEVAVSITCLLTASSAIYTHCKLNVVLQCTIKYSWTIIREVLCYGTDMHNTIWTIDSRVHMHGNCCVNNMPSYCIYIHCTLYVVFTMYHNKVSWTIIREVLCCGTVMHNTIWTIRSRVSCYNHKQLVIV